MRECLVQVPQNILDVLQTHGNADQVLRHAGSLELLSAQLLVGGGTGMDYQGTGIADVGQVGSQLQGLDELLAGSTATFHTEGKH